MEGICWAVGWFAGYVVLHLIAIRALRPQRYFVLAFQLFLIGVAGLAIVSAYVLPRRGVIWLNGLLIFGSLWVFYMVTTLNVMRSVSVRTLVELAQSPSHALSAETLDQLYETPMMFDRRIDSLVANGYLESVHHAYRLTRRGRGVAQLCRMARRALNLRIYG